jgi:hypothetical protein
MRARTVSTIAVSIAASLLVLCSCVSPRPSSGDVIRPSDIKEPKGTEAREEALYPDFPPPPGQGAGQPGEPEGQSMIESLPGSDVWVNQDDPAAHQEETAMAANPTDALNVVGVWQDPVMSYGWTSDGGATWQSNVVSFPERPGEEYWDPVVVSDSVGNFYITMGNGGGGFDPAIVVAKSTDGGQTFANPVVVNPGHNDGDKPYLAVDPANDNVYAVWAGTPGDVVTVFFAKSTDGAATFSSPVQVSDGVNIANGALPAVGPNGEIYVVWGFAEPHDRLLFDRSLDGGDTWLATDIVVDIYDQPRSPLNGGFRNPLVPSIAVDRTTGPYRGRIYVVWGDQRHGDPDILLSHSDDQGDTWSTPIRVNDDIAGNDADQWFPWIVVDENGQVHVVFLDRRDDPDGYLFGAYLATSTDGGATFGPNVRVSDGIYGPTDNGFLGDYIGAAVSPDNRLHPLWPDGRRGDLDVYTRSIDLEDFDEDTILNDGNLDGQYANQRCTGGATTNCDDNCPGEPNADQIDDDGDLVGNACDNCPDEPNTSQYDRDRDAKGDACDGCPDMVGGDEQDPDGDDLSTCIDNCPLVPNAGQEDGDGDGIGDVCDFFPDDFDNDNVDVGVDNCPETFNPLQLDGDGDGVGDLCDTCPGDYDPGQEDSDGDGAGDLCECQQYDPNDREPEEVHDLDVDKGTGDSTNLSWSEAVGADAYSISRGDLSALGASAYGDCLQDGVNATSYEDTDVPAPGQGYFYLVQAQSFDCDMGPLGHGSNEQPRVNGDPDACGGLSHTDAYAQSEATQFGTVSGSFLDTLASDDTVESITEALRPTGGDPFGIMVHRWTFQVTAGSRIELHVEGYRTELDYDRFQFYYSTNTIDWAWIPLAQLPLADDDIDMVGTLPNTLSGTVSIRVVDTEPYPGDGGMLDTVSIDELFVRTVE